MIDINKKYRTRDGREVRIYATDGVGKLPVHGAYFIDGDWYLDQWTINGGADYDGFDSDYDLIEIDEEEELLEKARKDYPKGTKFLSLLSRDELRTSDGNPYYYSAIVPTKADHIFIDGWLVHSNGQWAEKVKEHEVEVFIKRSIDGTFYLSNTGLADSVAKKKITFYEGEGL